MIVDAHMHIWDHVDGLIANTVPVKPLANGRIRVGDQEKLGMPPYIFDCQARAEFAVADFDAAGVDVGVVVQEYMDGPQNDYLSEVMAQFGDRFFMHGLPNFFNPKSAFDEARELFDRGFTGIKMCGGHMLNKVKLDDPAFMPLCQL
jgi:hypothetical protein